MADARIFLDAATAIFPTFLAFSSTVSLLIPSACRKRKLRRQRKKLTTEDRHDGDKPPQPQAADARASRTTTSSKRENERPAVAVAPSATEKFSENLYYNYYHSPALVKAEEQKSTSASSEHSSLGPDWQSPKWSNSLHLAPAGEKKGRNTFNGHDGVIEIDVTFGAEGSEGAASSSPSSTAPSTFSPYPKVEKNPVHESNSAEPSPSSWSPVDLPPLPITSQLPTLVAWFMFSAAANDSVYLFICATIAVAATSNFLLYPVVFDCARYKWDFFLQSVVSLLLAVLLFVLWFFGPWRERPGVWGIFATVLGVPYYTSAVFGMYVGVSEGKPDALGSLTMNCAAIAASLSWTLQGWFVARVPELAIGCGVYTLVNSAALVVNLCLRARLRMQKGNRKRNSCASNQSELQEQEVEVVSSESPPLPPPLDAFADAELAQVAGRGETLVGEEKKRKMNATMSKYCAEEHQFDFRMTSSVSCATNSTVASTSASVTSAV